jgi:5-methylcytosine-specific restriction protein A
MSLWIQVSPETLRKEREKARKLRQSSWWKQRIGAGICYHCGQKFPKEELTMDHLLPLARGGKTTKKNVVVSCKPCNTAKGGQTRAEKVLEAWASAKSADSESEER